MAAEHFASRGLQQLGFLGYTDDRSVYEMFQAYSEQLTAIGRRCSFTYLMLWDADQSQDMWQNSSRELASWVDS